MIKRLKKVITYTGLNQKDFAISIGLSPSGLNDILNKRTSGVSKTVALAIQAIHKTNANWLLTGEGEMFLPASEKPNPKEKTNVDIKPAA